MWYQFFLENIHFAINLGASLLFFSVFWLYLDAYLVRPDFKGLVRWVGFLLLSISFILSAIYIESTIVAVPILPTSVHTTLLFVVRILGYLFIIAALVLDPLLEKPQQQKTLVLLPINLGSVFSFHVLLYPVLAVTAGFLYLRRATIGLENHLKRVALTFFILSLSELLSVGYLLQKSNNSVIYDFVAPFGILWIAQHFVLLVSLFVLRGWVFGYLLKRFQSQLFIIYTTSIVVIFLLTTVAFSTLLLKNQETESLSHLSTDVRILQYSVDSKKAEALSDAQVIAQNPVIQNAVSAGDRKVLKDFAVSTLLAKKQSTLLILSDNGTVLARGDDPERIGDSFSNDPLVKKALLGESASSVMTLDGVVAPVVTIRSAVPIALGEGKRGVVIIGSDIDNAFVDGIKTATNLDASIYADNIRSATTYLASDGKSRAIGIKEESENIKRIVLGDGEEYVGAVTILNTPYLAAFAPIKDINNVTVGMLFVGRPQIDLLQAAGRSIELTFIIAVVLLALSIFPAYLVSKYISSQLT